jgi:histidine triad (HIT) family protein
MAMMAENIFKKIVDKELPAKVVHEDDDVMAFHDVSPAAPTHILVIPKKVVRTHFDVTDADQSLLGKMHLVANKLAKEMNLSGYRLVINCEESAGQSVPHLHMHLLSGRPLKWPPG